MATDRLPNRWGIAVAAVIMQICLGAVYGWSVFVKPLINTEHWTLTQVSLNFTLSDCLSRCWNCDRRIMARPRRATPGCDRRRHPLRPWLCRSCTGCQQAFAGRLVFRLRGPVRVGMGMGYICPVATLVKWFPDRRGLMTGVAVCGYGAGALVMSPHRRARNRGQRSSRNFPDAGNRVLGPGRDHRSVLPEPATGMASRGLGAAFRGLQEQLRPTTLRLRKPWGPGSSGCCWVMLFLNVSAGIMIISQASPMAQQLVGLTPVAAAGIVGVISIFNGLGRVFWAAVSDFLGRARVYFLLFLIQVVCVLLTATPAHCRALHHGGGHRRPLLWRRLRHHAVVHSRFLWAEVHGRNLWMDTAGLGCRRYSFADFDCSCPANDGTVHHRDSRHRDRDALLSGFATHSEASKTRAREAGDDPGEAGRIALLPVLVEK